MKEAKTIGFAERNIESSDFTITTGKIGSANPTMGAVRGMVKAVIVRGGGGKLGKIPAKKAVFGWLLGLISYQFMGNLVFLHRRKAGNFGDIAHRTARMGIPWGDTEKGFG